MPELISVIIPTYRRLEMLREAIESVKAQDYPNIEIIVVDDHSNDATPSIVKAFPEIQFYENATNKGPGFSRRFGLSQCHGKYVVFLDDDDFYTDYSFFSRAVSIFSTGRNYVFVAASAKSLNQETMQYEDRILNVNSKMNAVDYLCGFSSEYDAPLTFSTIFSHKHLVDCGVLNMEMVNHMPMIMRCLQSGEVYFLKEVVGIYRMHCSNISSSISSSFLIDNLKEKLEIYSIIKDKKLFLCYDQWWLEQIKTTVSYYVYGSHPALTDYSKVRKWCIENSSDKASVEALFRQYTEYLVDDRICAFKRKIKKMLGLK